MFKQNIMSHNARTLHQIYITINTFPNNIGTILQKKWIIAEVDYIKLIFILKKNKKFMKKQLDNLKKISLIICI